MTSVRSVEVQIVAYNSCHELRDCLHSVARARPATGGVEQTVAVLDNASEDGTADMVAAEFPDVRLIRGRENVLYGPASNELVRTSDADLVLLLNPDTVVPVGLVDDLVRAFQQFPDLAVAYPGLVDEHGTVQPVGQRFPTLEFELALLLRHTKLADRLERWWSAAEVVDEIRFPEVPEGRPYAFDFITSTCVMIRRDVAAEYGPFDPAIPMYDCDLDLSRRMSSDGCRAVYVGGQTVRHVGGASSTSVWKQRMTFGGRRAYYRRHGRPGSAVAYSAMAQGVTNLKRLRGRAEASAGR